MWVLVFSVVVLWNCPGTLGRKDQVKYYTKLIEDRAKASLEYQLPLDASQYKPKQGDFTEVFGTYDFIIIGAGSTGTVLANRLSMISNWKVLLIEAGDFGDDFSDIPKMASVNFNSKYNWGYWTTKQETACLGMFRSGFCPMPRGRGVGGSTLLNGLVYARGHPKDFDNWHDLGNPGWSYNEVLMYFKKSESYHWNDHEAPVDFNYHGSEGELNVEYHRPKYRQVEAFLEANEALGYNLTDYNGPKGLGASPSQLNTKRGRRWHGGNAFIKPVINRRNLKVLTGAYATKLLINPKSKEAFGVLFTYHGKAFRALSTKEVIVSAGAIATPQLLMLSGIGPEAHLKSKEIPVVQPLEVGTTLRDHSRFYGLAFRTNQTFPKKPLEEYVRQYLKGVGLLTISGPPGGVGFYRTKLETSDYPDLELIFEPSEEPIEGEGESNGLPWSPEAATGIFGNTQGKQQLFLVQVICLHCDSVGTIRLNTSNPYDYPLIDLNLLSDPQNKDIGILYEGIKLTLELIETNAFKKLGTELVAKPLPACSQFPFKTKDYWYCALRQLTWDIFHPAGTAPMGPDPSKGAVVDAKLKVYGVEGLRVADASVFPFTLSGHPNAPCVMIGEKLSDLIKLQYLGK